MSTPDLAALKRRRDAIESCITRLDGKIADLERQARDQAIVNQAQQSSKRLEQLDSQYKERHFAVIDMLDNEEQHTAEQRVLDAHDDLVANINLRLQELMTPMVTLPPIDDRAVFERRSAQLQARIIAISGKVDKLSDDPSETHLVYLYEEQLADLRRELSEIRNGTLVFSTDVSDPLMVAAQKQEDGIFGISVKLKKLLLAIPSLAPAAGSAAPSARTASRTVKLPKIDVPTFDGELLHWKTFWEQFDVSVHSQTDISATEKLVYLRHSLKDGSSKGMIEGLSNTGDQYEEAVKTLKDRFDRPRIIHQTHVRRICDVPSLKDGSGKEIRKFHDTVQQHLRALKAMGEEPTSSFMTALLELKLDKETTFEWQKASQDTAGIPPYDDLLKFLNLRAQASETCSVESRKHPSTFRKSYPRSATSFVVSDDTTPNCTLCKTQRHPLHACPQFKALPHDKMLATVRSSNVCLNCLRSGHFSKNCASVHRCRKCHHTLLHNDEKSNGQKPPVSDVKGSSGRPPFPLSNEATNFAVTPMVPSYTQTGSTSTLLMTCEMLVHAPDGTHIRARGLLDSGSSVSFVSERVAQTLRLPRKSHQVWISGIAGLTSGSPLQSVASFEISSLLSTTEKLNVSALVVPRVTRDLPTQPVPFDKQWNHLDGIPLADIDFGQPSQIDILLGADVYPDVLLQGRRNGPPNTPVAFETKLGWVLTGKIDKLSDAQSVLTHHVTTLSGDDLLRKFWEIEECPSDLSHHTPEEKVVVQHFAKNHSRDEDGRFVVPLPKRSHAKPLGESRSSAVRRFLSLERALHSKGQFDGFASVMKEYIDLDHAELVPECDAEKATYPCMLCTKQRAPLQS